MSEILARRAGSWTSDDLPFAIDLELRVEDRDVIAALANYPDGPARDEYALEALKIGVLALRRASSALDARMAPRPGLADACDTRRQHAGDRRMVRERPATHRA